MWESPITCPSRTIEEGWIDYNGHLNMAYYNVLFDQALDHVYDQLGVGVEYTRSGQGSCFTLEVHVNYLSELVLDDPIKIDFQLLDYDNKRLHIFEQMFHAETGELAATSEQLALHVDMASRRSAPFPQTVMPDIEALAAAHAELPVPDYVGRVIGIRKSG
ncbi:MAG: thioesterase family protein [Pseudomonadales bacterium]